MGLFSWLRDKLLGKSQQSDVQQQLADLQRRAAASGDPKLAELGKNVAQLQQILTQMNLPPSASASVEQLISSLGARPGGTSSVPAKPAAKPGKNIDLASDFLPIQREDLVSQAKQLRSWGTWFGRRDVIPPNEDPRTKLIDRALVTHGLLTPEQLQEIHRVGDEMERLRPSLARVEQQLQQVGEKAVEAERARKAQIKEQKKAESAERKRLRAEAIARRRATDIVFLGRGVSGRLGDRTSNAEKLKALGLPVLAAPAELAQALKLPIPKLRWLAFHTEVASRVHYVHFEVPKKSGGTRILSAPHRSLANAQQWILENIVGKLPAEPAAHGFVTGKSILSNAQPHTQKAVVVNLDLEGFFPNITFPRVRSVFQRAGYSPAVASILALLCTECPRRQVQYEGKPYHVAVGPRGLPQGTCTSPGLSNQVARRLDKRLAGLAKKMNLTYTRYADDITLSGGPELREKVGYLMARVRHIAQDEGFVVNEKKSRVQRRNASQQVTGLVVNDKPSVRRQEIRRIRAILHHARREGLDHQNRDKRPNYRAWLEGKIAYISMVRPEVGARLKEQLKSVR